MALQRTEADSAVQLRGQAGTPDTMDKARVIDKLRGFSKQLDAILPYLSLAVSAVGLLNHGRLADSCLLQLYLCLSPCACLSPGASLGLLTAAACQGQMCSFTVSCVGSGFATISCMLWLLLRTPILISAGLQPGRFSPFLARPATSGLTVI